MGPTGQADTTTEGPQLGSRLTVAGWQTVVLSVMGMVVLAGTAAGAVLLDRTDAVTRELTDDIQPARVSAYQLQGALRDQETALRGYLIAADRQFLAPYVDGQRVEQQAAEDITARLGDRVDLIADLTAIERAGAAWRSTYAQPLISSVIPGAPNVVNASTAERGKAEFDRIRGLFDTQNADLAAARTVAVNRAGRDAQLARPDPDRHGGSVHRRGDPARAVDATRGDPSPGGARRFVPADRGRRLRATASTRGEPKISARSRATSRTCGGGS